MDRHRNAGPTKSGYRARLIRRRWETIVVEAVLGSAALLLVLFWRRDDVRLVLEAPCWLFVSTGICVLIGISLVGRGRWGAFAGVRHLATYPPPWIAALLGSGVVFLSFGLSFQLRQNLAIDDDLERLFRLVGATCICAVVVLGFVSGLVVWGRSRRKAPIDGGVEPTPANVVKPSSFSDLREWLLDDKPVNLAAADVFDHARIAARIASRMSEPRPPAQAVVGPLGSGKTTLRHLVHEALRKGTAGANVRLVPVELWPYENSKAAVEGVIRALIEALACEINVIGFRGLPAAYVEAIRAAGGLWSALVRLEGVPSNPFKALNAIDDAVTAIGLRYVVWIEDLERFAAAEGLSVAEERLNPIRALLYGLDQLESVTVVTATTSLSLRVDIEKIARYVEELPPLPTVHVRTILGEFRSGCRVSTTVIDPADPVVRKKLDDLGSTAGVEMIRAMFGTRILDVNDALLALCSTPRALKQALRSCLDVWDRLAGEVDFDDVLAISIVREAEPSAFALIQEYVHDLRREDHPFDNERERGKKHWDEALTGLGLTERALTAIKKVVEFVFDPGRGRANPQGMMNRSHANYWERFLSIPQLSHTEKDQPILQTMLEGDDQSLIAIIEDETRSAAVEDFKRLLKTERIVRLLVLLVERRSQEGAEAWPNDNPPGLIPLWRMWNRRSEAGELEPAIALREVLHALNIAVPTNLTLASEIEYHFTVASQTVPNLLGDLGRIEAKTHLRQLMAATYTGQEASLANALAGAKPQTLLWLCWGLERLRSRDTSGVPFDGWVEFAGTILAAAHISPRVMLPQIAGLITTGTSDGSGNQYRFDAEQTRRLFGDVPAVLRLFENERADDWANIPYFEAIASAARQAQGPD